jgi:hypothetical protein
MEANKLMMKFIRKQTHKNTAKFFLEEYGEGYLVSIPGEKKHKIYKWDANTKLYKKISYNSLANIIMETIGDSDNINKKIDEIKDAMKGKRGNAREEYMKEIEKITDSQETAENIAFCEQVAKVVVSNIEDEDFMFNLDTNSEVVNFKNGLVNLRTGKFRRRKFGKDFYSKALNYKYGKRDKDGMLTESNPDDVHADEEIIKFIKKMFLNICNDNVEITECVKEYLGYCMTGDVNEQVCLALVGIASAGKTILIETFEKAMHIYVKKLDNKTFDTDFAKNHKQMSEMEGKRLGYVEELSKKKMDVSRFKDWVGGNHISNEIMYDTVKDIRINFKLVMISNNSLRFDPDGGVERRGRLVECTNKFVSEDDYNKLEDKTGHYVADKTLLKKFDSDDYKLALFHVLFPYAMKHYKPDNKLFVFTERENSKGEIVKLDKPIVSTKLHREWKEICGINDQMAEFLDLYFTNTDKGGKLVKPTDKDVIGKDTFLSDYRKFTGLDNLSFQTVISDIKKHGYKYDSQRRCGGERGIIIGIKRNDVRIREIGKREFTVTKLSRSGLELNSSEEDDSSSTSETGVSTVYKSDFDY